MTTSMTYEQAQAKMPKGWVLWGSHGDDRWRAGAGPQENHIGPADSMEEAAERAQSADKGLSMPPSINPSTATYQLAGQ